MRISIRALFDADKEWFRQMLIADWGSEIVIVHGDIFRPVDLPGFLAEEDGEKVGLLTYHVLGDACEIVTLNSWREGRGVGSTLLEAARQAALRCKCRRLWLVTTKDNLHALHFYQERGFTISAIRINAVESSRRLKPEIPLLGNHGIPIRDEIELESLLA